MQTMTRPATEKQQQFIERLLADRQTAGTFYDGWTPDWSRATSKSASAVIDYLLTLPKRTTRSLLDPSNGEGRADTTIDLEAGIYTWGATMYRVYLGQQSGKMLVKKVVAEWEGESCSCDNADHSTVLCGVCAGRVERRHVVGVSYEYLGLASKHLPEKARRMTLEEVGSIGIAWNHCIICGHRLDVPESVDRGIGPVCARKYA